MLLVTYTTPSHAAMCERFVVSRGELAGFDGGRLFEDQQQCPSGSYNQPGFAQQTWNKVQMLSRLPVGEDYCYLDADCVIFPGLAEVCRWWIKAHPGMIGHGDDFTQYCMGVIVWRQTEVTAAWFKYICDTAVLVGVHDQNALHIIMQFAVNHPVKPAFLCNTFFANHVSREDPDNSVWKPGDKLDVSHKTLCWHANFCIGVENKTAMLEEVLKIQEQRTCNKTHVA